MIQFEDNLSAVHPLVQHSHLSKNLGRLQWFDYIWTWTDAAWTVLRIACFLPFFWEDLEDASDFFFSDENGYLWLEEIRRSPVDMVGYPIIYKVLAPSKRWLLFGISEPINSITGGKFETPTISTDLISPDGVFGLVNFRGVMGLTWTFEDRDVLDRLSSSMSLSFLRCQKKYPQMQPTMMAWQFFVTFFGWLSDPFKG